MNLNEARRIARRYRRAGRLVKIVTDKAACDRHDPGRHRMSGSHVVIGMYGKGDNRYLWEWPPKTTA